MKRGIIKIYYEVKEADRIALAVEDADDFLKLPVCLRNQALSKIHSKLTASPAGQDSKKGR